MLSGQGPFREEPDGPVPFVSGIFGSRSHLASRSYEKDAEIRKNYWRWEQVDDGSWYAFYANVGPGRSWCVEHDTDPNWWRLPTGTDPPLRGWACRHGFSSKNEGCEHGCGEGPALVTDEEFEAYRNLVLKSLQTEDSK